MKVCSFDGCGKKVLARGLCSSHYRMNLAGEPLRPIMPPARSQWKKCTVSGCKAYAKAHGLCLKHYQHTRRGDPPKAPPPPKKKVSLDLSERTPFRGLEKRVRKARERRIRENPYFQFDLRYSFHEC